MLQACEALAEAHALGIVHRDLKPANLFLTRRRRRRAAREGARLRHLEGAVRRRVRARLTTRRRCSGSPLYMSPEQMRSSRSVDARTDIWSLGVILYELFAGTAVRGRHVRRRWSSRWPRSAAAADGPAAGRARGVVQRCLEKDPARRFQDIAALARALARYAQSETQAAVSVQRTKSIVGGEPHRASLGPGAASHAASTTLSEAAGTLRVPRRGGRRWPVAATLAALIGSIVVVVFVVSRDGSEPPATRTVSPPSPVVPARPSITTPSPPAAAALTTPTPPAASAPPVAATSPAVPPVAAAAEVTAPAAPSAVVSAKPGTSAATRASAPASAVSEAKPAAATASASTRAKQPGAPAKSSVSDAKPVAADAKPAAADAKSIALDAKSIALDAKRAMSGVSPAASPVRAAPPPTRQAPPAKSSPPAKQSPSADDDPLGSRN